MRRAPLLLFLLILTCKQEDPVAQTIGRIADAAEERDAGAVMQHIAANYSDAEGGRAEVEANLRRYFFAYKTIDITIQQLTTTHGASSGEASFRVLFIGLPKSIGGMDQYMPRSRMYDFDVTLEEEDGELKIVTARWREAGP